VRLQAAESERYSNPLVYALAWLSALLALAVGALWWRQSRARGAPQWWAPPAPVAAPAPASRTKGLDFETATPTTMSGVAPAYEVSMLDSAEISMPSADLPMTVPAAAALRPSAVVAEPARELSVEELIDLEQQAEFFVVLGQDEAAIELLMSHVRNDGGISPLPYLKLLEIYKRRGESDAYERIRDRFNRRFNAYAPDWASDLQQGLSLEAYPETLQRLQELWGAPARAMETLAAALFRRDASDQTYDLPAYRELLFLYAVARDFQEHGVTDLGRDVDLLLPMHDDVPAEPIAQRVHSTGFQNSALMTQPLDLDVSLVRTDGNGALQPVAPTGLERRSNERAPSADSNLIPFDLDLDIDPQAPTPPGSR
jgi:pilus assembly protein FimV